MRRCELENSIILGVRFSRDDWQRLKARAMLECRSMTSIVKSSTNFYAKYGPWNVNKDMIAVTDKLKGLKSAMTIDNFDIQEPIE